MGNDSFYLDHDEFIEQYRKDHMYCPKCGSEWYGQTLVGYILNIDKPEEYKDKNSCMCSKCGDKHIVHDRVNTRPVDNELRFCYCGKESTGLETGFDLCYEHSDDV